MSVVEAASNLDQLSLYDILAEGVEETIPTLQSGSDSAMLSLRSTLDEDDPYAEFAAYAPPDQLLLLDVPPINAPLVYVDPERIQIQRVSSARMVSYQQSLSRAVWKPRFRNLAFTLVHEDTTIAIICLSSPVLNRMPARDDHLNLPRDDKERGTALRSYAELSVCVGVQPLAWHWNIGKLAALVATTLGDEWSTAYGDEMLGVTTTSLWGKGSQYNRIYKHLGYTKGNGTVHVPNYVFDAIRAKLKRHDQTPNFGPSNTNVRPKLLSAYAKHYGSPIRSFHGEIRAIYYHEAQPPDTRAQVIADWHQRWGLPRYERTKDQEPPYQDGKST